MEYSIETVSQRMILVIVGLSAIIVLGGVVFYSGSGFSAVFPFAVGVVMAMAVNVIKVLWLKKTVESAVDMEAGAARFHLQKQYFVRLVLTAGVFLVAVYAPDHIVNFMGTVFGIFTLPIATRSMQFFLRGHPDTISNPLATMPANSVKSAKDAIDKINSIVAEKESAENAE